jgi:hypothetical protein
MLTAILKAVKMLLSCCPKNSQDVVLAALKAVQDAEKKHPHKDQVQRLIPNRVERPAMMPRTRNCNKTLPMTTTLTTGVVSSQ